MTYDVARLPGKAYNMLSQLDLTEKLNLTVRYGFWLPVDGRNRSLFRIVTGVVFTGKSASLQ